MPDIRQLVIDIGTNSVLALLADRRHNEISVVFDRMITTRLGENLVNTGEISDQGIDRTVAAIEDIIRDSRFDSAVLIGTEALRIARNSASFTGLIRDNLGLEVRIISGEKEAELSFTGALYRLPAIDRPILLADVGGGSTELVIGTTDSLTSAESVSVGALKLKEKGQGPDRLDVYIDSVIDDIRAVRNLFLGEAVETFIGTGGTITSMAAIKLDQIAFEPSGIHGISLTASDILAIAEKFERNSPQDREKLIPFDPRRADLILPGAGIFLAIMSIFKMESVLVSTGGLRYGAMLRPDLIDD